MKNVIVIPFLLVEYSSSQTLGVQERKSFLQIAVKKKEEYQSVHIH